MKTLLHGLDQFKARGLVDKSIVMWTNHVADGPCHSFRNVPHIIWGNGGGLPEAGQFVDAGNVTNNKLFNTLITGGDSRQEHGAGELRNGDGDGRDRAIRS